MHSCDFIMFSRNSIRPSKEFKTFIPFPSPTPVCIQLVPLFKFDVICDRLSLLGNQRYWTTIFMWQLSFETTSWTTFLLPTCKLSVPSSTFQRFIKMCRNDRFCFRTIHAQFQNPCTTGLHQPWSWLLSFNPKLQRNTGTYFRDLRLISLLV